MGQLIKSLVRIENGLQEFCATIVTSMDALYFFLLQQIKNSLHKYLKKIWAKLIL